MSELKILNIPSTCTGCGACVSVCPRQALELKYNEEGFYYPHLEENKCIECKACEKVCHILNYPLPDTIEKNYVPYAIKAKSTEIVQNSSSGGLFSLLANYILALNGVVYGARYNYESEKLEHCSTELCSLSELRKSKYIESYLGGTFHKVQQDLLSGKYVLFCGTPCQVKGLKSYLDFRNTKHTKLLLVRFICHGVPSNKFFTDYKHYEERKLGGKVVSLDFRPKNRGWKTSNLRMKFSNGKVLDQLFSCNYYYYYFQHNFLLRSSCYQCTQLHEVCGDFTIGDFWGVQMYKPNLNENEGLTLALVQTDKAKLVLQQIVDECEIEELPQIAVDYIYKDYSWRKSCEIYRTAMMKEVLKCGYMPAVLKKIKRQVIKNRIHYYLVETKLWKWIKRR